MAESIEKAIPHGGETERFTPPKHVAIIPDAQDMWDYHNIKTTFDALERVVDGLGKQGVEHVSFYVHDIGMGLRLDFLHKYNQWETPSHNQTSRPTISFRSNGRKELLPVIRHLLREAVDATQKAESDEEKQAIREAMAQTLDEDAISNMINPSDERDVDLQIYFGQRKKVKNWLSLQPVMLWQSHYAELAHTATSFIDLTEKELTQILREQYKAKNRRYGALPVTTE